MIPAKYKFIIREFKMITIPQLHQNYSRHMIGG